MSKYVLPLTRISVLFALSACASVNADKDFLCKAQAGSPCTTIAATDGTETSAITPISEKPEDTLADVLSQKPLTSSKNASSHPDGGKPTRHRVRHDWRGWHGGRPKHLGSSPHRGLGPTHPVDQWQFTFL